jgi:hypothetical protein
LTFHEVDVKINELRILINYKFTDEKEYAIPLDFQRVGHELKANIQDLAENPLREGKLKEV